jgi:aspartyl-tRNA(Asn)/glutamyl-tRNA(Gln) amidotransferase subunit A
VTPATVGPAPDTSTTGNPCFNSSFSYLGWPVISFPIGRAPDGLPLALQLAEGVFLDLSSLFAAASWCESVIRRALGSEGADR